MISPQWALTAAHCAGNARFASILHSKTKLSDSSSEFVVEVEKFIVHEKYDGWLLNDDIALVKLKVEVNSPFDNFLTQLPKQDQEFQTGTPAVLIGWGLNGVIFGKLRRNY